MTQDEMLKEILENSRKTKSYMKWQLYITLILVVLPLIVGLFLVPIAIKGMASTYGSLIQLQ